MAVPWSPHHLTNLSLWMDASDASTITQSGGLVSKWVEKTSALPFTQLTTAYQPTFVPNVYNGLSVIRFGSDDFFSFPRPIVD